MKYALLFVAAACACAATAQTETGPCSADGVCAATTNAPVQSGGKHIWAHSLLYADAPLPEMRKWLTEKPETDGKFIVVEFWRTWCGACKRTTPFLNALQKKYGSELAVVGVTGETEETVKAYAGPKQEYFLALDAAQPPEATAAASDAPSAAAASDWSCPGASPASKRQGEQGRYEASFGVWGWPHVVVLEPLHRTVVWEGFPGLKGHELTEAKIEKILAVGRAMKAEAAAQKK